MQQRDSKERGTAGPTTSVHCDRQHMLDGTETNFLGEAFDNVGESSRRGMNCHGRKDNSGQQQYITRDEAGDGAVCTTGHKNFCCR